MPHRLRSRWRPSQTPPRPRGRPRTPPGARRGPEGHRYLADARQPEQCRADQGRRPAQGARLPPPQRLGPGSVLPQPGFDTCFADFLQCGGGGQAAVVSKTALCSKRGSRTFSRAGPGCTLAPDVDLACQVQIETSEHAQCRGALVRGTDGSQGVGHGVGGLGDRLGVTLVGLDAPRSQVREASPSAVPAGSPLRHPCPGSPPQSEPR